MELAKRLAGAYLAILGAAVAVLMVIDPLIFEHAPGDDNVLAWTVLNWLMAVGLPIALLVTFGAKRAADAGSDLREYLTANLKFYAAAAVALLFYWNAVQIEWAAGDQSPDGQVWTFVGVVLSLLFVTLGLRLWRGAGTS